MKSPVEDEQVRKRKRKRKRMRKRKRERRRISKSKERREGKKVRTTCNVSGEMTLKLPEAEPE
jgi:hypothetical protein